MCAVFWFISIILTFSLKAQERSDTVGDYLPVLEVSPAGRSAIQYEEDGSINVKSGDIMRLLRSLGESDFLNQMKQLSHVVTTSDYSSGLSVDGSEGSQSQYLIGGAPVIFPYRVGGVFSTFNTPHFSSMRFSRASSSILPDRLGASFVFIPAHRYAPGVEGTANIGMTSSSISFRAGISNYVALNVSGRISYVDQLYGKLLKNSHSYLRYWFYDLNVDLALRLSEGDHLKFSFFHSKDKLGCDDKNYSLDTYINWKNLLFNISYSHVGKVNVETNIFSSRFRNILTLSLPQFHIWDPSSFVNNGFSCHAGQYFKNGHISEWTAGLRGSYDQVSPQWALLEMSDGIGMEDRSSASIDQKLLSLSMYGQLGLWLISEKLKIMGEASVGLFSSETQSEPDVYKRIITTEDVKFLLFLHDGLVTLSSGLSQQPIHQVGFSELGLASNFWIGACDLAPVQRAFSVRGTFRYKLPWWNITFETSAYWKKLWNQAEYQGTVLEAIDLDYNPFTHLIISDGFNYGFSLGVSRQFGNLTGDVGYSFGDGWRHTAKRPDIVWHSLYSEGNVARFNVVWHEGRHWSLSATWRIASGRRYTPVNALYAIGGNIAMEYGERNSARLPSYQRLDLGATYFFNTGKKSKIHHSLNLSVLNAYGYKNVEMQYFRLNSKDGKYSLKRIYSLYRFLPSISYSIEF